MTGTGFALINFDDPNSKVYVYDFGKTTKTPSAVLFKNNTPIAFGSEAIQKIQQSIDPNFLQEHFLVKSFKLLLNDYDEQIQDGISATDVATILLTNILDIIMEKIESSRPGTTKDQIRWVFTVPAVWNERAKARTIQAIVNAGFVESTDANDDAHLLLIHEPEAAAVCCIQNTVTNTPVANATESNPFASAGPPIPEGSVVLIIDAGGGTIDVTVHKVERGLLKEKTIRGGGKFGSEMLDKAFWEVLDKEFGKDLMTEYKENFKLDCFRLNEEWCNQKLKIRDIGKLVNVQISPSLISTLENANITSTKIRKGTQMAIKLTGQDVTDIYTTVMDSVISLIKDQVEQVKLLPRFQEINYTYIVGGFGSCVALQNRIKMEFSQSELGVITCPVAPENAIMSGAAIVGINSEFIKARRSTMTYGIQTNKACHLGEIPGAESACIRGEFVYTGVLDKYVIAGAEVLPERPVTKIYKVSDPNQTVIELLLFGSTSKTVKLISEPNTVQIGNAIRITFPKGTGAREISVSFYFGRGSLKIVAIGPTGEKLEVTEPFSSK
jgi:molecular chaperone DnaK (HSP70)